MLVAIVRRLLLAALIWLGVVALGFAVIHAAPGGPFDPHAPLRPDLRYHLQSAYGLDQPWLRQFGLYLWRLLQGDLGPSLAYRDKSVTDLVIEGLPLTAQLGAAALALALVVGFGLGAGAALRRDSWLDYAIRGFAKLAAALPSVLLGPLLVLLVGLQLRWLPASGLHRDQIDLAHMVLPVLTLALPHCALIAHATRVGVAEVLDGDAVRMARAKGLPEPLVIRRYAMPLAVAAAARALGAALAGVFASLFVVETVFALPGFARSFIAAALERDDTTVLGGLAVFTAAAVALNFFGARQEARPA